MAEEEEEDKVGHGLLSKLLAINYYEVVEPVDFTAEPLNLRKVPNAFATAEEYCEVFEPLMLEECFALMQRGVVESAEVAIPHRCVTGPATQIDGFLVVQVITDAETAKSMRANDILLITKDDPEKEDCRFALNALGVVVSRDSDLSMRIRFYLREEDHKDRLSEKQRVQAMVTGLSKPNSGFYVTPLASLSTIIREWNALHSLARVNFLEILLSGRPKSASKHAATPLKAPVAMEEALKLEYNDSQMKALTGGLAGQEVVLIQGPPGTGKTTTLLGLLSIILHAAPLGSLGLTKYAAPRTQQMTPQESSEAWIRAAPWIAGLPVPRDSVKPWEEGSISDVFGLLNVAKPLIVSRQSAPKAHVLVCAPSNSALDEIVIRLLKSGIVDRTGKKYAPSIVRIGLNPHHSIHAVELDNLVDQRLSRLASSKTGGAPSRAERERIKLAVIEDAHIVCSTLSFSGSGLLQRISRPFDVVVIDEAAQAVEPATLIPLCTGAKQVFLIGDPVQLPATVISKRAVSFNYDVSLFKRLQSNGYPVHMLDTQYRMHPRISAFPSATFYHGNLKNGPGVAEHTNRAWHVDKCLGPFAFFDVKGTESFSENQSSLVNDEEAEMVVSLYLCLVQRYPHLKAHSSSIAIISPYKAQVNLLKSMFKKAMGDLAKKLDINTIDGFQGREKEIAIFSAVRSNKGGKIGFVADERRINVGLTRARCSMLVVGNANALNPDPVWHSLLRHARLQRSFFRPKKPFSEYLGKVIAGEIRSEEPSKQDLKEQADKTIQAEEHVYGDEDDYSDDSGGKATGLDPKVTASDATPTAPPPAKKRAPAAKSAPAPASKKARKGKKKGEAA